MLALERREEILHIIGTEKSVVVADLSKRFNVTEETIRRDLEKLDNQGLLKKTYGGAVAIENVRKELPYNTRKKSNVEKKEIIAELTAGLVKDDMKIMVDASSTAVLAAKKAAERCRLTLITNSLEVVMNTIGESECRVISSGGSFKERGLCFVGSRAEETLKCFNADMCIISCKGLSMPAGATDTNDEDIRIKRTMLEQSAVKVLVADSTKLNEVSFIKAFGAGAVDIVVTDSEPDEEWKDFLEENNVELIYGQAD